jgi:hypothetical protein
MIKVLEFKVKLDPIARVLVEFSRQHPLSALQDCSHYIQLASYWLQGAADHLFQSQLNDDLSHSEGEKGVLPPPVPEGLTNADPRAQMIFMFDKLEELEREIFEFNETFGMETKPRFFLNSALQRIIEAKFNIVLTGIQYERLQSTGGFNLLRP